MGRARSGRQRVGVDLNGVWPVSGLSGDGVLPRVLGGFFRRSALRDEGGLSGDGEGTDPAKLSQLVSAELSVRICHFPYREVSRDPFVRDPGSEQS